MLFTHRHDEYGWHQNHEGLWYYTAFVESGRVLDEGDLKMKQAFLEIAEARKAQFRFTANQNLIVSDIKAADKAFVEEILERYGVVASTNAASPIRRNSLACVAFNTCPLALAEAQRYLPSLITKLKRHLQNTSCKTKVSASV